MQLTSTIFGTTNDPVSKKTYLSCNVIFDEKKVSGHPSSPQSSAMFSQPSLLSILARTLSPLIQEITSLAHSNATSLTHSLLSIPATSTSPLIHAPLTSPNHSSLDLNPTLVNILEDPTPINIPEKSGYSPHPIPQFTPYLLSRNFSTLISNSFEYSKLQQATPSLLASPSSSTTSPILVPPHLSPPMSPPHPPTCMLTRAQAGSLKPKEFPNFKFFYPTKHPLQALNSVLVPKPICYSQSVTLTQWRQAMVHEVDALLANQMWSLVPRPTHKNVISNKWFYKLKQRVNGIIDRYKARLVTKGDRTNLLVLANCTSRL